ncbi:MAG: hypothetical protein AB1348_07755 [Nitrospirota bacterium]
MGFLKRFFRKDNDATLTYKQKRFYDEICKRLDGLYEEVIEAKSCWKYSGNAKLVRSNENR